MLIGHRVIKAQELEPAYRAEIDIVDESRWNGFLGLFDDATLYQTWAYGKIKVKASKLSHVILWHQNELVAMSQVRIMKLPLLSSGIAYIHWGPLWKKGGVPPDLNHLRNMIRVLRQEYVLRRGLMLRIIPKIIDEEIKREIRLNYENEGFTWSPDPDQTFVVDVSIPLEEIRDNFQKDWRRDLRNAEKQDLRIVEGTGHDSLGVAVRLAKEMKERKKYFGAKPSNLLELQKDLPEEFKIRVMYAEHEREPVAALGWQNIGRIGFPVIAATGNKGLKLRASFLLWWKMIEFYHGRGFHCLDVGGVNASRNPGGYLFKSRITGKKDPDPDQYVGQFTACQGRFFPFLFKTAYAARNAYKHTRAVITKVVHSRSTRRKKTT